MSRKRFIAIAFAILSILASPGLEAKGWEKVKAFSAEAKSVVKEDGTEILAVDNTIIVSTTQTVEIKIFTILGRIVTQDSLEPGAYRYNIPAHGVYIVKTETLTCKVAV